MVIQVSGGSATQARAAEAVALQNLKDSIVAIGLPAGQGVALFAAATSYAKASARRIVAERVQLEQVE